MKKYVIFIFILTGFICLPSLAVVDEQLILLEKELHELRLQEMKAEITSENYMKYEWDKYTEEIQHAEKLDQKIKELKKKIDALKHEKEKTLKNEVN